jgi:hypothetical protein
MADKPLYGKLVGSIASSFNHIKHEYKLMKEYMDDFLESMMCDGIHGDGDDKEEIKRIKDAFDNFVSELKILMFNLTKLDNTQAALHPKNE